MKKQYYILLTILWIGCSQLLLANPSGKLMYAPDYDPDASKPPVLQKLLEWPQCEDEDTAVKVVKTNDFIGEPSANKAYKEKEGVEVTYNLQPLRQKQNNAAIFYGLLITVLILTYIKHTFGAYLKGVYNAFRNENLANQFFEEYNHQILPAKVLFNINIVLVFSMFVYLLLRYFGKLSYLGDAQLMLLVVVGVSLVVGLRYLTLYAISKVLPVQETIQFYLFNLKIVNIILSILLLPVLFLMAFSYPFLKGILVYLGIGLTVGVLIYGYYRGVSVSKKVVAFHKFHFFVYLCTLEIAPLLIIYKLVGEFIV